MKPTTIGLYAGLVVCIVAAVTAGQSYTARPGSRWQAWITTRTLP